MCLNRRTRTVMMCEQCGNEFHRGEIMKKNDKEYIKCPYCGWGNRRKFNRKKKRIDYEPRS